MSQPLCHTDIINLLFFNYINSTFFLSYTVLLSCFISAMLPEIFTDPFTAETAENPTKDTDTSSNSYIILHSIAITLIFTFLVQYTSDLTPLESSLLYSLMIPTTMGPELVQTIAIENNPQQIKTEKENAKY